MAQRSISSQIDHLNNEAVSLIRNHGNYRDAAQLVRNALLQVTSEEVTSCNFPCIALMPVRIHYKQKHEGELNSALPARQAMYFDIYEHMFQFSAVTPGGQEEDVGVKAATDAEQSAALIYNLAFCYHMHVINSTENQVTIARKTFSLYNTALKALETTLYLLPEQQSETGRLLRLALANNLGNLHATFYQRQQLNECVSFMSLLILSTPIVILDTDFFHVNIFMARQSLTQSAAAA